MLCKTKMKANHFKGITLCSLYNQVCPRYHNLKKINSFTGSNRSSGSVSWDDPVVKHIIIPCSVVFVWLLFSLGEYCREGSCLCPWMPITLPLWLIWCFSCCCCPCCPKPLQDLMENLPKCMGCFDSEHSNSENLNEGLEGTPSINK